MSLDNHKTIDMVVRVPDSGEIALVIFDHEPIEDEARRDELLRKKMTSYVGIVVTGQLAKANPAIAGKPLVVEIVYTYPPTPMMQGMTALRPRGGDVAFELPVRLVSEEAFCARYGFTPADLGKRRAN